MKAALACLTVFAIAGGAGAQITGAGWFDLPVPGGERTLTAMGVDTLERAAAISLAARMPDVDETRPVPGARILAEALREAAAPSLGASEDDEPLPVPMPLSADLWRQLLLVTEGEDLFTRLIADRAAVLVAAGFTSTDRSVREFALRDPLLVRRIYRDAAGAFAVVARNLRIEGGHVVVPGGVGAKKIWDALAGQPTGNPKAFITALLTKDDGRLAWYFDTLAALEPARMRAAWPEASERDRLANARALYDMFRRVEVRWRLEQQPFRRAAGDPSLVLMLTDVDAGGGVTGPTWPWFWETVFAHGVLDRTTALFNRRRSEPMTVTAIVRAIASSSVRERKERFEMFRLAQRAFPAVREAEALDLGIAISGYRRYKTLLLALERMQIASPALWAALVEAAVQVDRAPGRREDALASFQGAFALVYRMWHVGSLDASTAGQLLRTLADGVRGGERVPQVVGRWITATLVPALAPRTLLDALAGPVAEQAPPIAWEDLEYRLDFAGAERQRLDRIRTLTNVPPLEEAIAADDPTAIATALKALVYATALGDPDGAVTLGPDIATRHDFGMGSAVADDPTPWAMPVEMQIEGRPWHVRGSLIGLDLGLARLSMRHLAGEQMPGAPSLTMNDYGTLAQTAVSMRAADFTDADRDEIVAAIARGAQRVAAAGRDAGELGRLADEARLSPATRELLPWIAATNPQMAAGVFSLRDLLWLGKPALARERLDRWGVLAQAFDGRLTTVMPPVRPWEDFAGRADTGLMSTQVPDLTLRLAQETARLGLPAALVPSMLTFAVQDYWYAVSVRFADDWPAMARAAAALEPQRAEDYVAALAGTGLLRLRGEPR
jgi:hypothetical protein